MNNRILCIVNEFAYDLAGKNKIAVAVMNNC